MNKFIRYVFFVIILLFHTPAYSLEIISHIPNNPNSAFIMIHGWRQDGNSMTWLTKTLSKEFPNMAIYYPTAPDNAPNSGYEWFIIPTLGEKMATMDMYEKMMSSALNNVDKLHELIDDIHNSMGIDYENIHIGGFSQGGFMSILVSLTNDEQIGKVISFSGVPILFTKDFTPNDIVSAPNILIIQGTGDHVIPQYSYNLTDKTLRSIDIIPTLKIIKNMPHTINNKALSHSIEFLKK